MTDTSAPGITDREPIGIRGSLTSYADPEFSVFIRKAFLASAGYDADDLDRPVVGIADTTSDYTTCHRALPELLESVRRGVLEGGALPLRFPTLSLGEILTSPTTMLYRNLLAIETEEMIRAQPMDAVILLGGCDKTVPAQLMAAASADLPAIACVAGPMRTGEWRGERLGACTDCRRLWGEYRAGNLDDAALGEIAGELCPTAGTCMVMGTASTMACVTEALGMMIPGAATAPATSAQRLRIGVETGRRAAALAVTGGPKPSEILTPEAFQNALAVLAAVSGSTNAVIHLLAIAKRAGVALTLDDVRTACARTPVIVDAKPVGTGYLEDLDRAGGVPALLKELEPDLNVDVAGVTGTSLREMLSGVHRPAPASHTIRSLETPLAPAGALTTVAGTLAPDGAVIKAATATRDLLTHEGPAVVFESPEDAAARIDDPVLDITPEHVIVVRNAGPVACGMPEAGSVPIPRYLAMSGVRDMVRVTDGRMSGTAYGTVVLHVAPEAAVGGPLALVRDGDTIRLDLSAHRLDLVIDREELVRRGYEWQQPPMPGRGWRRHFAQTVEQANLGCDLNYL